MNNHYFFVTSTESIYDRVLPLIEEKSKGEGDIFIFAGTKEITNFFNNYTNYPAIQLGFDPSFISRKTYHKLIPQLLLLNSYKEGLNLRKDNLYFFTSSCYISLYSLIQHLAKDNKIYFYTISYHHTGTPLTDTKSKIQTHIIKKLLGIDVYMSKTGGNSYPRLSQSFFKNNHITTYIQDFNTKDDIAKQICSKITELKGREILFIEEPDDIVGKDRIDDSELWAASDCVYDMINKDKIIVKQHQKKFDGYGKLDRLQNVSNYIPTEFLFYHPWKLVIGIESFSLVMASRLTNAKVISLIDMFYYYNDSVRKELKKTLEQESKGKILFPESIKQLEEMLK